MLLTIITAIAALIACTFLICLIATKDSDWTLCFFFSTVLALVLLICCACVHFDAENSAKYLRQEYTDIYIMYDTVNESNNEALRYHFYERINEYNKTYDKYMSQLNDIWIKNLIDDDLDDIEKIKFELRGVPND